MFRFSTPSLVRNQILIVLSLVILGADTTLRGEERLPITPDMASPFETVGAAQVSAFDPQNDRQTHRPPHAPKVAKPAAYASLNAALANWDADPEPDGWRALVQLFDIDGVAVIPASSQATFELRLRTPTQDRNGFQDVLSKPVRWSMKLAFDENAVANLRLPVRSRLPSVTGAGSIHRRLISHRNPEFEYAEKSGRYVALGNSHAQVVASDVRARVAYGLVHVKISIPSVNVLEAVDAVMADESALIDTQWPNR